MDSIIHGEAANPMTAAKAAEMQKNYSQSNSFTDTILEEYAKQQEKIKFDLDLKDSSFDFNNILQEMRELYEKKNHDYGNSFSETIQEFGFTPAIARINDKFKRVKQMVKGEQMQVNESMRDNLIDIANYCILTIIEIDKSS